MAKLAATSSSRASSSVMLVAEVMMPGATTVGATGRLGAAVQAVVEADQPPPRVDEARSDRYDAT